MTEEPFRDKGELLQELYMVHDYVAEQQCQDIIWEAIQYIDATPDRDNPNVACIDPEPQVVKPMEFAYEWMKTIAFRLGLTSSFVLLVSWVNEFYEEYNIYPDQIENPHDRIDMTLAGIWADEIIKGNKEELNDIHSRNMKIKDES